VALPHVVVIGAGFGGLRVAKRLGHEPVTVTVIDAANHHLFQPLLYQVALAGLSPADIAVPVRSLLRRYPNVRVLLGEVTEIRVAEREVLLADGARLTYDYVVLAAGATTNWFGHEAWAQHAMGLKDLSDAVEIRSRVLLAFEAAEREPDAAKRRSLLTFVIIGGGPTGVELAGTLAELSRTLLAKDFRVVQPGEPRILLLEGGPRVVAAFDPALSDKAQRALQNLGVDVQPGRRVLDITAEGVRLEGEFIATTQVIWAAGVMPRPVARTLGTPLDRHGLVIVGPDCAVPGHPEVFAIGDIAHFEEDGRPLPGLAPVAMQQALCVADNILRTVQGRDRTTFHYRDKGIMATIGRSRAVAQTGKLRLSGTLAWLAWLFVHILYLAGFRNRLIVLAEWTWQYVTFQRGARLITRPGRTPSRP
jgi:NADH dehydrogenase